MKKDLLIQAMETHRAKPPFDFLAWYQANEQQILGAVIVVCIFIAVLILKNPAKTE
jgi:hypothetical protein